MLAGPPGFGYARRSVTTPARIYMASPLGFSEAGRHFYGGVLVHFVRSLGFEVLDPWALADPGKIDAVKALPHGLAKRDEAEHKAGDYDSEKAPHGCFASACLGKP